jgi:hypothetical protein
MITKTHRKEKVLRFGDFIAAAYRDWGRHRARGLVWVAVNARLVEFLGGQRVLITAE